MATLLKVLNEPCRYQIGGGCCHFSVRTQGPLGQAGACRPPDRPSAERFSRATECFTRAKRRHARDEAVCASKGLLRPARRKVLARVRASGDNICPLRPLRALRRALSRQMSIGHFRVQNLPRAATIHEQKQWSFTVSLRAIEFSLTAPLSLAHPHRRAPMAFRAIQTPSNSLPILISKVAGPSLPPTSCLAGASSPK